MENKVSIGTRLKAAGKIQSALTAVFLLQSLRCL